MPAQPPRQAPGERFSPEPERIQVTPLAPETKPAPEPTTPPADQAPPQPRPAAAPRRRSRRARRPAQEETPNWVVFGSYLRGPELRQAFRLRCMVLGIEMREATTEAIEMWLDKNPAPPEQEY